jgi:CheY-like chemotaxis protein
VPKILVADDNSNIQKMVGLALKDQGIDVVAVGNGEAAVRKIADLRPDLVLADVFMPVRNGYEVCQFVKMDASLAHIPVILLVGAFDPLDEQEAQRVGADGVLKKPFVPPDPLISMVKSALQRAGVSGDAPTSKSSSAARAADLLTSAEHFPAPSVPLGGAHAPEPTVSLEQESFVDEIPLKPEPVKIDSNAQTVAFGSLLETPAEEQPEDDPSLFQTAHPELAADRDWRDPDAATEEEEEEEEKPAAWRHEDVEKYAEATSSESGSKASKSSDWRSGGFEQIKAGKTHSWEPVEETPELVSSGPLASNSVAPPTPVSAPEIPATDPDLVSSTQFVTETWTAPSTPAPQAKASTEIATAVVEPAPAKKEEKPQAEAASKPAPDVKPAKLPPAPGAPAKDSWFSVPSNPWNAEIEKANKLASAWDLPAAPITPAPPSGNGTEKATEGLSEETQKVIEQAALPPAAVEAIREEAAQVAEDATQVLDQATIDAASSSYYATETLVEPPGSADAPAPTATAPAETPAAAPNMDDLVAKVLSQMSPDVLQAVTREILKPVVEAMVKEQLKPKK